MWFDVDKEGLSKLLAKKGKEFVLFELIQNAWDTNTKEVYVYLKKVTGRPLVELEVEDEDPEGFANLAHSYTLFAESVKKDDPSKRGRFNLGEKLVLALCKSAEISSTTGTILFNEDGTRKRSRKKLDAGSVFKAQIKMNQEEFELACNGMSKLIPPKGIKTVFNGRMLKRREPVTTFEASLPTIKSDSEGNLTRTIRKCTVSVYKPEAGEVAHIYEMGIPVVETGDYYHIDVGQKVPVNMDRDNVPPSYLKTLRTLVLNETFKFVPKTEASKTWVTEALEHDQVSDKAVNSALTKRFGKKRAIYDLSDQEANNRLTSEGYQIIHGGSFSKKAWDNIKRHEAAKPSGEIKPTPKPYGDDPNAPKADIIPESKWTPGMKRVVTLAKDLAIALMEVDLTVRIIRTKNNFSACYGNERLDFNLKSLGRRWFSNFDLEEVLDLLIHEFGHHYEMNHLSEKYYDALTRLAGQLTVLALECPDVFDS